MISYKIQKNGLWIQEIVVSGHANQNAYGQDIVCASVSVATIMSYNLLEKFSKDKNVFLKIKEGYFELRVLENDDVISRILENLEYTLNDLQKQYPKYIQKL